MRNPVVVVVVLAAGLAACGGDAPLPSGGDGVMVLELGGEQASLRGALAKAGLKVDPPIQLVVEPPAPPPVDETPPREPEPKPKQEPPRDGEPSAPPDGAPKVDDAPAFTTVTLGEGQTLIHLARKHLGDGNRFREILTLNGWSEAESRRLKPGTKVKIPKAAPARRTGR
jgi:nucleoid-associated protein YgaU